MRQKDKRRTRFVSQIWTDTCYVDAANESACPREIRLEDGWHVRPEESLMHDARDDTSRWLAAVGSLLLHFSVQLNGSKPHAVLQYMRGLALDRSTTDSYARQWAEPKPEAESKAERRGLRPRPPALVHTHMCAICKDEA